LYCFISIPGLYHLDKTHETIYTVGVKKHSAKYLTQAALIAALYVVLTWVTNMMGLANGQIQIRLSEVLGILPLFTSAAIPGLGVGCLLANIITGTALPDVILGSLATLVAAFITGRYCHDKYTGVIPPIAANTIVIPLLLRYAYGIVPLWLSIITVFAGEFISAGVLGILLYNVLFKYREQLFPHET